MTLTTRKIAGALLVAGAALLPVVNATPASAMAGGKMMHGKMSDGKMMHGKMAMSSSEKMMMSHMTAADKATYSHMSKSEKMLMMKMMHGKM